MVTDEACARAFARAGATVVIAARGADAGQRACASIAGDGGRAHFVAADVGDAAGRAAHHAYVASKHAVIGLTRSVGLEYAARGVRVNAICAGVTRTAAMQRAEELYPSVVAGLVAAHPMGRMASEDEVAAAALWLCSPAASFTTASALAVDGGFLAA